MCLSWELCDSRGPQIYFGERRAWDIYALSDKLALCWDQLLYPEASIFYEDLGFFKACISQALGSLAPQQASLGWRAGEDCICLEGCFIEHGGVGNTGNIINIFCSACAFSLS